MELWELCNKELDQISIPRAPSANRPADNLEAFSEEGQPSRDYHKEEEGQQENICPQEEKKKN